MSLAYLVTHHKYRLVELIVLNVGLSAGILSQRVFSMFVLEALLLTFMTTPAVLLLYPSEKRVRVSATGANFLNVADGGEERGAMAVSTDRGERGLGKRKTHFTVVLDKIEHLPSMMALAQFMGPPMLPATQSDVDCSKRAMCDGDIVVDALRLIELSDRTSAVIKSSFWETLVHTDPLLGIFRTFGELNGMAVSSTLSMVPYDDLATSVVETAARQNSQLVLVPWLSPREATSEPVPSPDASPTSPTSPFDSLFRTGAPPVDRSNSSLHARFVRGVFAQSTRDVALFVDQHIPGEVPKISTGPSGTGGRFHLFLPFFGGPDDRLALEFAVQLCSDSRVSATVIRYTPCDNIRRSVSIDKPPPAFFGDSKGTLRIRENAQTFGSVGLAL